MAKPAGPEEINGWKLVMHYDYDPEDDPPYTNIWEHKDGRRATEEPGFCNDPDLKRLLLEKQKISERKERKRKNLNGFSKFLNCHWILLIIMGTLGFPEKGVLVFLSLLGYGSTFIGSYSLGYVRKGLKEDYRLLSINIILIGLGSLLINLGGLYTIPIESIQIPLFIISGSIGILKGLIDNP